MTDIAHHTAPAIEPGHPAASIPAQAPVKPAKIDWSRVAPPKNLESARVEELSIDGICGVY